MKKRKRKYLLFVGKSSVSDQLSTSILNTSSAAWASQNEGKYGPIMTWLAFIESTTNLNLFSSKGRMTKTLVLDNQQDFEMFWKLPIFGHLQKSIARLNDKKCWFWGQLSYETQVRSWPNSFLRTLQYLRFVYAENGLENKPTFENGHFTMFAQGYGKKKLPISGLNLKAPKRRKSSWLERQLWKRLNLREKQYFGKWWKYRFKSCGQGYHLTLR